jgi:RNA polymerase sigma factor (sigma-70 family)
MTPQERFAANRRLALWCLGRFCRRFGVSSADYVGSALYGLWQACLNHDGCYHPATWGVFACKHVNGALLSDYRRVWFPARRERQVEETFWDRQPGRPDEDSNPDTSEAARELLASLPDREAQVLGLRVNGLTQTEIGRSLHVTHGRVGQIESRAVRMIRDSPRRLAKATGLREELFSRGRPAVRRPPPYDDEAPWQQVALRCLEDADVFDPDPAHT